MGIPEPIFNRIVLLQDGQQILHICCTDIEYVLLIDCKLVYSAIEDEFGPIDLGKIFDISQKIHAHVQSSDRLIALVTSPDVKVFTNAVLVLGAYMIMRCDQNLHETMKCLAPLLPGTISYKNVTRQQDSIFELRVEDCLSGMVRAKKVGWVDFGPCGFDADEYKHLDNPLNGDLHEVVPGKLVLMQGPRDLPGGALWQDTKRADGSFAHRDFSVAHYADILVQLDVQAVVRCSVPVYDSKGFEAAGIAVVDLCWEEGASPPIDVVAKFLAVAERLPGAIAVHCGSGRGRSGTLAALYMMKHHGFTAREAMGWLRIVRPGRWHSRVPRDCKRPQFTYLRSHSGNLSHFLGLFEISLKACPRPLTKLGAQRAGGAAGLPLRQGARHAPQRRRPPRPPAPPAVAGGWARGGAGCCFGGDGGGGAQARRGARDRAVPGTRCAGPSHCACAAGLAVASLLHRHPCPDSDELRPRWRD
jgi:cell division cycle 14